LSKNSGTSEERSKKREIDSYKARRTGKGRGIKKTVYKRSD
jgi:hypothetical protein